MESFTDSKHVSPGSPSRKNQGNSQKYRENLAPSRNFDRENFPQSSPSSSPSNFAHSRDHTVGFSRRDYHSDEEEDEPIWRGGMETSGLKGFDQNKGTCELSICQIKKINIITISITSIR